MFHILDLCVASTMIALTLLICFQMKKEPVKAENLPNDTEAAPPTAKDRFDLKELARARDKSEYTPLLRWAQNYVGALNARVSNFLIRILYCLTAIKAFIMIPKHMCLCGECVCVCLSVCLCMNE